MSEGRIVRNLIISLVIGFVALAGGIVGSVVGNELINSEDSAVIPFGFALYLAVGIVEILLGYGMYKTWKSSR